jgi:hypothetical protein
MEADLNQMGEGIQVASLASMDSRDARFLSPVPRQLHLPRNAQAAADASKSVIEAERLSLKDAVIQIAVAKWISHPILRL